jgi:AcrR family transcriptional regulator
VARSYRSPLRDKQAAETRAALLAAASRLFLDKGWTATGMRDVATEASVSTETVYAHFSSKRGLLRAVMDVAVVGDDRAVPLAERPEFTAQGRGRRSDRIRASARLLAGLQPRTAPFAKVLREAAAGDDELAAMLREVRERQRVDVARSAELLLDRPPTAVERDGFWALASPEVYLLLVEDSGWTVDQYEEWIVDVLERVLPRS